LGLRNHADVFRTQYEPAAIEYLATSDESIRQMLKYSLSFALAGNTLFAVRLCLYDQAISALGLSCQVNGSTSWSGMVFILGMYEFLGYIE
jgi:hypothetical protein